MGGGPEGSFSGMTEVDREEAVATFLSRHGFGAGTTSLALAGGGRHAVYKVSDGSRCAVLKRHGPPAPTAERDSFERELACHEFVALHAPESCPTIIGSDAASRSLLFAWVEGAKLPSTSINQSAIRRMAEFLKLINTRSARTVAEARALPAASEAGLAPQEHLLNAKRRMAKLLEVPDRSPAVGEMKAFLEQEVVPAVAQWETSVSPEFMTRHANPVFSPSDFGFHNVLASANGPFVFLDFEHAGWDDAAKLCADFFIQPECILSRELRLSFLDELNGDNFGDDLAERTFALLPLQSAKWTTIILNPFVGTNEGDEWLAKRLAKARAYFTCALAQP